MSNGPDFKGFKYESRAVDFLESSDIDPEYVCLAGSVSLSMREIRDNNDVDIIVLDHPEVTEDDLPNYFDHIEGSFECVGYTDEEIVWTGQNHDRYRGLKIVRPELVFSYKYYHKRSKDIPDIDLLEEYALNNPNDWHWGLITYRGGDRLERGERFAESILSEIRDSLREDGLIATTRRGVEKMVVQPIHDRVEFAQQIQLLRTVQAKLDEAIAISDLLAIQYANGKDMRPVFATYKALTRSYQDAEPGTTKSDFLTAHPTIPYSDQSLVLSVNTTGIVLDDELFACALFLEREIVQISPAEKASNQGQQSITASDNDNELEPAEAAVLRDYGLLFQAILWPAVAEHYDDIERSLRDTNRVSVWNTRDIDFESDEEFATFISDLYENSPNPEWSTRKKIHRLRGEGAHVRLLELHFPDPRLSGQAHADARALKDDYRRQYKGTVDNYFADIVVHIGDNYTENRTVCRLLREITDIYPS